MVEACAPKRVQRPGRDLRRLRRVRARRARRPSGSWSAAPAPRACGWSAPTASASSTPTPRCGSTPPSRRGRPAAGRVGFFAAVRRARHRRSSSDARGSASASPPSCRSATRPTSAATTCCSTGRTIRRTDVVLLYLESFGNPRKFARLARRVARRKPIVAVKSGRHVPRSRRVRPATPVAGPDAAVDALFAQAGVIRVDTLEQLFDVAGGCSPTSRCRRAAGSPSSATRGPDRARRRRVRGAGLVLAEYEVRHRWRCCGTRAGRRRPAGIRTDPLDLGRGRRRRVPQRASRTVLADPGSTLSLVSARPPCAGRVSHDVADVIAEVAAAPRDGARHLPRAAVAHRPTGRPTRANRCRCSSFPEAAARALARVAALRRVAVPEIGVAARARRGPARRRSHPGRGSCSSGDGPAWVARPMPATCWVASGCSWSTAPSPGRPTRRSRPRAPHRPPRGPQGHRPGATRQDRGRRGRRRRARRQRGARRLRAHGRAPR